MHPLLQPLNPDAAAATAPGEEAHGAGPGCGSPTAAIGPFPGSCSECRICLLQEPLEDLVSPCHCTGTMQFAHLACLKSWAAEKRSLHCELCSAPYRQPYAQQLEQVIAAAPPPPPRYPMMVPMGSRGGGGGPDGPPIILLGTMLPSVPAGAGQELVMEPTFCEWRNLWSYVLILMLLLFAVLFVTVISKRGKQEAWMITLWQVLLVVLPIYLMLRIAYDLYRHRLAQQLAAAAAQRQANLANLAGAGPGAASTPPSVMSAAIMSAAASSGRVGRHEVIVARSGHRIIVLQRQGSAPAQQQWLG